MKYLPITLFELIASQPSFHPTDCIAHEGNWCHILICALYPANPVSPVQEQEVRDQRAEIRCDVGPVAFRLPITRDLALMP